MANRVVYGNSFSLNGWPMVDQGSCVWIKVPGTNVSLQIREGEPAKILGAFAADFNAYVEPLRDADSACWTPTNSVATSNHLSGTACDFNWGSHPFKVSYAGFDQSKIATMRELLAWYEDMIWWGQDWSSPKDPMHLEMHDDTYGSENFERVESFISRKIRADGFSTFRRGGVVTPPPPVTPPTLSRADGYAVRIIAEGQRRGITPKGIQIALATAIVESNITVYANSKLPKSLALPHDAVGSDGLSVGIFQQQVKDSGNGWWWGDEATCMGVESSAGLFYDRLVRLPYNGDSKTPGAFAQQIQGSAFPARYDEHWAEAVAIYNRLATNAPPTQGDDDLSAEAERQIGVIYQELTKKFSSRSPLRHLGEGLVDTATGFILNTDGSQHVEICRLLAGYGHPPTLALLREVAGADPVKYPDRQDDAKMAQAILADLTAPAPAAVMNVSGPVGPDPQVVYLPAPQPVAAVDTSSQTEGQKLGALFDALTALELDKNLPADVKAPMDALLGVLQNRSAS